MFYYGVALKEDTVQAETQNKKFGFLFLSAIKIKPNKMAIISINTFENSNAE